MSAGQEDALVTGFCTLAFGDFIPNAYFALLTAIIFTLGLATDSLLLPAISMIVMRDKRPAHSAKALHEPDATAA